MVPVRTGRVKAGLRRVPAWRGGVLGLLLVIASPSTLAGALRLASGVGQVSLLELYTSQGCSSCPPAERWLSEHVDDDRLWRELVPVALHVDYWDSLGWRDTFASAANSERQRAHARAGQARTVYTPGFFLDGRAWRGWTLRLPPRASAAEPGSLDVSIEGGRVVAVFPATGQPLDLHVAILGFGIESAIGAGENRGRTLHQDFVALARTVHPAHNGHWDVPLPAVDRTGTTRLGIALWVSPLGETRPLQATGGWLPGY